MTNNIWKIVAGVALAASVLAIYMAWPKNPSGDFGSIGVKLAENYDPYIRYNQGFYTALPIQTTSTLSSVGLTETGAATFSSTFKLGSSGTAQSNQVVTTCNPTADTSIAATSTGYIFCTGVTGVTSSDEVFASFSTSTVAIGTNWVIVGANASTTAGAIDIKIMNLTGTAAVPSAAAGAQFASSTRIWAAH